ncbi:hypothetical protein SAMN05444161_1768 [Rhizobiales bacterium GAS191]|jgi:hypothetical protein|nr:hypothetical protein SAMN05444161_1768 [Rhizobiales bacterium GAS191]
MTIDQEKINAALGNFLFERWFTIAWLTPDEITEALACLEEARDNLRFVAKIRPSVRALDVTTGLANYLAERAAFVRRLADERARSHVDLGDLPPPHEMPSNVISFKPPKA